ncbi:MAG: FtsQ-type POTRA domain-containing protein [Proteobacteria bacterium]|nr:FtsQ-type POTRA domain-containing protein [Pseudomonadota bacterium]
MKIADFLMGWSMKKGFRLRLETKKHRARRHAGSVMRELGRVILLTGAIVAVAVSLLIGYDWVIRSPYLAVRETVVRGCKELTEKEILTLAAIRPSANILAVNPDAIARRIRSNPWIREAFIGREFPGRLVIMVRERTAIALLQREGGLYFLDSDGEPFKQLESDDEANLPVLTGFVSGGRTNESLVKIAIVLLNYLAGSNATPAIGTVSEVHGNETFGLSLFTDTGLCLQLGFDGFESKFQRLTPVMADLDRKNMTAGFLLIDLSDPAKVNVQQRNLLAPSGPAVAADTGKGHRM